MYASRMAHLPYPERGVAGSGDDQVLRVHPADAADIVLVPAQRARTLEALFKVPELHAHVS